MAAITATSVEVELQSAPQISSQTTSSSDGGDENSAKKKAAGKGRRRSVANVMRRSIAVQKKISESQKKAQQGIKNVTMAFVATHHVALSNKVGVEPTGEDLRMAQSLHSGIKDALNGETGGDVVALDNELFRQMRSDFGIDRVGFRASVELAAGRKKTDMKMIPTAMASGKSKAFFFLSPDQHFFFKSATSTDVKTLRKILPEYSAHVKANKESMLPRYVALFRVHVRHRSGADADGGSGEPAEASGGDTRHGDYHVDFVCMTNAFGGTQKIGTRFDLKGSTYKRDASEKEKAKDTPTFKDGDWVGMGYQFPPASNRDRMLAALDADTAFLARRRLIDYSLLVGIHREESATANKIAGKVNSDHIRVERTPGLFVLDHWEEDGSFTRMYIALVDILTPYGLKKYAETFFLSTLRCGVNISCQPPQKYARRFMQFIRAQAM